jgi:putative DNA primase/helicase
VSATDALTQAMTDGRVPFSEDDLANRFSTEHADDLRYCEAWKRWLVWDQSRWRPDVTVRIFGLAREVCSRAAALCNQPSRKIASAATIAAVERLARSDLRHAATPEDWDADPFLLNTPGCVVDLRTGQTRPNRPDDYMIKQTTVAPGGNCPLWHNFLHRIADGDGDLEAFLQRVAGYSLTGSVREHCLFFTYGTGANGKSVFLNTMAHIAATYHVAAPIEMFMASRNDRHPTELAGLQGARLVTAMETEGNRRWAESRVKALTGGDPIAARFMRGDFFTFTPVFKLLVAGNHKPTLRTVDEAIRRRLHLIPFNVTIPKAERDPDLPEKLRNEWPGILAWAIEGAGEWHANGLQPPSVVTNATLEYLAGEDLIAVWLDDRCYQERDARTLASALYKSFKEWAEGAGERPGTQRAFSMALESHGYRKEKTMDGRYFHGLRV